MAADYHKVILNDFVNKKSECEVGEQQSFQPFETVILPEGEFELFIPEVHPCSEINTLDIPNRSHVSGLFNTISGNCLATNLVSENDKTLNCSSSKEVCKKTRSVTIHNDNVLNVVNHNSFNEVNKAEVERSARVKATNRCLSEMIDLTREPLSSVSFHNKMQEFEEKCFQQTSAKSIRNLTLEQKEKVLKTRLKSLYKWEGLYHTMNKAVSDFVPDNNSEIEKRFKAQDSVLARRNECIKLKPEFSKLPKNTKQISVEKSDVLVVQNPCGLDISGLKRGIIKASRTLIKTEKSLKVLSKIIHNNVVVTKDEAVEHLNNFRNVITTFRRTMNGIDTSITSNYSHLFPKPNTDSMSVSNTSREKTLSQRIKRNISGKKIEIIIPATASEEVKKRSDQLVALKLVPTVPGPHGSGIERTQIKKRGRPKGSKNRKNTKKN